MKHAVTCLLILALVIPAEARERTPLEQARRIDRGSKVVVKMNDKQILRGRLGEVSQDHFTLEPLVPGSWSNREVLFQDVRKIGSVKEKWTLEEILLLPVYVVVVLPAVLVSCGLLKNNCNPSP